MNTAKVAVNVSELTVPGLLNKARLVTQRVTDNPGQFPSCVAANAKVIQSIANLEAAHAETSDGAKSKIAYMHDKEKELVKQLILLGHAIELDADGDAAIIHLSGLDVKKTAVHTVADFSVKQGKEPGMVSLKVKSRDNTIYQWQYCQGNSASGPWTDAARSTGSRVDISNLPAGLYWFRVVLIDGQGDHEQPAISFAVN